MKRSILFVTGTDTGVGKTMLTCLLARRLLEMGRSVAALKPLCSGDRRDAMAQRRALKGILTLEEINPWYFRRALSPLLAARLEHRKVTLAQVKSHVQQIQKRFPVVLIEGAGGLLSPLGEAFDSRDLIKALRAKPIVVCRNELGAINQVRLVLAALPDRFSSQCEIVMMNSRKPDSSSSTNPVLLGEFFGRERVHVLPWLGAPAISATPRIQKLLDRLINRILPERD